MLAEAGLTLTDATGTRFTVIAAVLLCPSLVAVIVTAPAAAPVTSPVEDTVATAGVPDAQVTDRPRGPLPAAPFRVVVSCTVAPTSTTAVAGLTVTDATGTIATVTLAVPLFPSLVAVIVADPAATPVTSPAADTVAIAVFELVQLITRPLSTLPAASLVTALSCVVAPTKTFAVAGLTVTEATGTLDTVTAAVPLCPSLVAVIVTAPTATPVTRPLAETVPTAPLPVVQVSARPLSTLPPASLRAAVSCTVPPTYMLGAVGLTVTDATGTIATVTLAVPLCPSLVAVIVADPTATPVTSPAADTVAIAVFELVHATPRPVSTFPAASFGVALSCVVAPTKTFAVAGLTVTEVTGTLDTLTAAVPLCPSLVAVIVTAPTAPPVTSPAADTVAIATFELVQLITRPLSMLPTASLRIAVSCTVPPTYMLGAVGLTVTDATGTIATVTLAVPLCPSLVAVIVADPTATPVTRPLAETVAIVVLLVVQVTVRPVSTFPFASLTTAPSCCAEPTEMVAAAGLTATEATERSLTARIAVPVMPLAAAVTTYPPGTEPAPYKPEDEIVPPWALHVTFTATESPVFSRP